MGAVDPVEPMKPMPAAGELLADMPGHPWPVQIGIDVGQVQNPTAIVAVEVVQRATGRTRPYIAAAQPDPRLVRWTGSSWVELDTETVYLTRHLERVPLGTRYPDVALRIADVVCSPKLAGRPRRVLIDQTGVGRPIVELVSDAINTRPGIHAGSDVSLRPIIFTSGMEYDPWTGKMGKAYMVSRLQALMQWERLKLPPGHREAEAMRAELRVYSIKVSQDGADTYGALKTGQFDDLATALGLACLEDPNEYEARILPFSAQGW